MVIRVGYIPLSHCRQDAVAVLACNIWGTRPHDERGSPQSWQSPQRGPGQSPWTGGKGESPPEAEALRFLMFNGSHKFAHFSTICKRKDLGYFCYRSKKS